jgi:hypothetical protein
MQAWFALPAILFSIGQSLSYVTQNGGFFGADVGKVLDQTRLLMTAVIAFAFFGKLPSRATWNSLFVITLAAAVYTMTKMNVEELEKLRSGKSTDTGAEADYDYVAGAIMCMVNCLVMCFASIVAEKFLKQYKKTPFYVQKIALETPQLVWLPIWNTFLKPMLDWAIWNAVGKGDKYEAALLKRPTPSFTEAIWNTLPGTDNFRTGFSFSNVWLIVLILSFCAKSYLNGILVKQMSSVVKQICQVTSVSCVYFCLCMIDPKVTLNLPQIAADLLVFFSVFSYALSNRDKERKRNLKKEIADQKALIDKVQCV